MPSKIRLTRGAIGPLQSPSPASADPCSSPRTSPGPSACRRRARWENASMETLDDCHGRRATWTPCRPYGMRSLGSEILQVLSFLSKFTDILLRILSKLP